MHAEVFIIWIFCISQSHQQPTDDFVTASINTAKMVSKELEIRECFQKAQDKAQRLGYNKPNRHAIMWMSMYATRCIIDENQFPEDRTVRNFPFRLNKELRCTLYPGRNERIRNIFLDVGVIMDRAIEELYPFTSPKPFYRGETKFPYRNEAEFVENGFFSSTTDINVALQFADGNALMIINGIEGVSIESYAEDRFQYQKEVLAKRNCMFRVGPVVTDAGQINQIIRDFGEGITQPRPKEIIYLNRVIDPKAEDVDRITRIQQERSHDYCAPK